MPTLDVPGTDPYISIDRALRETGVPFENHRFIKDFLGRLDITGVRVAGNHVVAERADGGMSLHIENGSTNGFLDEDEIIRAVGAEAPREPSGIRRGWRVIHPLDPGGRESGPMSGATPKRRGAPCLECFVELSLTGVCENPQCSRYGIAALATNGSPEDRQAGGAGCR